MDVSHIGVDESVSSVFPPENLVELLADVEPNVSVVDGSPESLADCEAVITFAHRDSFFDVEWVHTVQAGYDRFPQDRFREAGIVLTNSSGIHGDEIGETVASYVLALARRLHTFVANQQDHVWEKPEWDESWTVAGERACVVGLGGLGRGIVDRLDALGMEVVGVRRTPKPLPGVEQVYPRDQLHEAIGDARFVVLAVPLTDETAGMIDVEALAAMREDSYLVNVARGQVVDQDAFVQTLREGSIEGAALDVFETEPLPESSPLWDMEDVIVTPHCGAFTRDYPEYIATLLRESARRVADGEDPVNRVL